MTPDRRSTAPVAVGRALIPVLALVGATRSVHLDGRDARRLAVQESARSEGSLPVLVIPALFADSPEPGVSDREISRVLFDGPISPGTLTQYYDEVSGGRLRVAGTVLPWSRTTVTRFEAAGELDGHGWVGERLVDYIREAIRLGDALVDYGQFDNDGPDGIPNSGDDDGLVDALVIEFLEPSGSCDGPGIWPHVGGAGEDIVTPFRTSDPGAAGPRIGVGDYMTTSASDCSGTRSQGPSVVAHELGHLLGLFDTYEFVTGVGRADRHWNVGCFALMGAGSWGCGSGPKTGHAFPPHMAIYNKERLGWGSITRVPAAVGQREFTLEPVQAGERGLQLPLREDESESFIIEYRPRAGFDASLPAGGILVYHQDSLSDRRAVPPGLPSAAETHLVEADADHLLRKTEAEGGNRGVASDVFPADGTETVLTNFTSPSTRGHEGGISDLTELSLQVVGGVAIVKATYKAPFDVVPERDPVEGTVLTALITRLGVTGALGSLQASVTGRGALPAGLELVVETAGLRIEGAPRQAGLFSLRIEVSDSSGQELRRNLVLDVRDLDLDPVVMLQAALESTGLPDEVNDYLDVSGNENGTFDLGDMRQALLRRNLLTS
ncbi:MAG: immune inhibitor A [Gemmatimonadetes bacterium]|nr:immune inhibitor A [Gemmatimonadota bacterium]